MPQNENYKGSDSSPTDKSYYHVDPSGTDIIAGFEDLLGQAAPEEYYVPQDDSVLQKLGDVTLREVAEGAFKGLSIATSPRRSIALIGKLVTRY